MTLPGMKISEKGAAICTWVFFSFSVVAALFNTIVEPSYWKSAFYIYNSFIFYFFGRNPQLLVADSWNDFDEMLEKTDHARYVFGTIPLFPSLVLVATLYISISEGNLTGGLLSLLPF